MNTQRAHDEIRGPARIDASRRGRLRRCASVLLGLLLAGAFMEPARADSAALVIDPDSGTVLYSYRIDAPHPPASLTKMMTLYLTFEALRDGRLAAGEKLRVSRHAAHQRPSRLGLRHGTTIRVEDAILALVTKSANDASVVLAEAVAGSEPAFADQMTSQARALGMSATVFRNASGLHHPDQVTTARDMARLAAALIREFPERYPVFSMTSFSWRGRRYRNHNSMLASYAGADGIKTGYVRQSGYNLVASAQRRGRRLIGVVMGGESPERRAWMMATMLDYGFSQPLEQAEPSDVAMLPYAWPSQRDDAFELVLRDIATKARPMPAGATARSGDQSHTRAVQAAGGGGWAIQVGAYRSEAPANEAALRAADHVPALLGDAQVLITQTVRSGQRWFRARLTGLSEGQARSSCRRLAAHDIPCMTVAETGEFRTVSRVQ
ncbi:MAG: D-alanyl-D-alanine carboxypeptidase [Rhodospirillales bacterium]|nr:MAG: D-alanyl-D-alanine carboxypeptidase [Rhodospirillales bacterium]